MISLSVCVCVCVCVVRRHGPTIQEDLGSNLVPTMNETGPVTSLRLNILL